MKSATHDLKTARPYDGHPGVKLADFDADVGECRKLSECAEDKKRICVPLIPRYSVRELGFLNARNKFAHAINVDRFSNNAATFERSSHNHAGGRRGKNGASPKFSIITWSMPPSTSARTS